MSIRDLASFLKKKTITASAPCRVDMGGTLDIRTFHFPLSWIHPCTVNLAMEMRTLVRLLPHRPGHIKVTSKGFGPAAFKADTAPFRHPLGLMFAVAAYFRVGGVHIDIASASPVRSALGGSSVAAVALIAALGAALKETHNELPLDAPTTARLAHAIEESVAGVPCGMQDQLAAVYGGVHQWHWPDGVLAPAFGKTRLIPSAAFPDVERHVLVAYCGAPHASKDINGTWVAQFLDGGTRHHWAHIARLTHRFADALANWDIAVAVEAMNREMAIRAEMTPAVLDAVGQGLVRVAQDAGCGARITGAGGGGCVWALGQAPAIALLKSAWEQQIRTVPDACLLPARIAARGVETHS